MSGPGERRRVVDLYSATPMAAARVAERLGVGAVHDRVKAYRGGGVAALRPENRNSGQPKTPT